MATQTNLAELYPIPIPGQWGSKIVSPPVKEILNACVPESISTPQSVSPNTTPRGRVSIVSSLGDNCDEVTGTGICPNPLHRAKTVFARHMEERFTWEHLVAGIQVGGVVPLKWRGCLRGCLAFLDGNAADNTVVVALGERSAEETLNEDTDMETNTSAEDIEMDESVVQVVSLDPISSGIDDFEDDA